MSSAGPSVPFQQLLNKTYNFGKTLDKNEFLESMQAQFCSTVVQAVPRRRRVPARPSNVIAASGAGYWLRGMAFGRKERYR